MTTTVFHLPVLFKCLLPVHTVKIFSLSSLLKESPLVPQATLTVDIKAAVLLGSTDLQGKAYLLNMTQHNGESGCVTCEETGFVAAQGKGHTSCYPYRSRLLLGVTVHECMLISLY